MDEHECCECVPRLRAQNKKSSDEWTRRTADQQSELDGLRHLMREATKVNRTRVSAKNLVISGLSRYGQATLAAALKEADEAAHDLVAAREETHRWRRKVRVLEDRLERLQRRD